MTLYYELKRRNVFRVGAAYVVASWLVIQIAETIFPLYGFGDSPARITVTLLAIGFPLFLLFSWVFEITPDGLKKEKDIDRAVTQTHKTGKHLDRTIIVLLAMALGYFAFDKFVLDPARDAELVEETTQQIRTDALVESYGKKSIAVLPFVNMSEDANNEYFSDGISEELLNLLTKIPELRVISRSSAFSFKGKDIAIPEVAKQLNVAHVLEGSVRKAGNRVRITAQLIEARSDTHLWSETYDRELNDIFAIQDEISSQIVQALKIALGTGEEGVIGRTKKPTENLEAYELFLRGRFFWQRRGADNIRRAIDLLDQATKLDPQFARAWASLAAAQITLPNWSNAPNEEHVSQAKVSAQKALALDDSLAEAYAVLGGVSRSDKKWVEAETQYLHAIASEPGNSTAHMWYGEHLVEVGRIRDSLEQYLIAYQLDPLHVTTNVLLGLIYLSLNDTNNILKYGAASWDLGNPWGLYLQALAYLHLGEFDQALEFAEHYDEFRAADQYSDVVFLKLFIEAKMDVVRVPLFLETLAEHETKIHIWFPLSGYVAFRRLDDAYRVATMARDSAKLPAVPWMILWRHDMAPFRQDPRFAELVNELGLLEYWREYGWPDACQPAGDSVVCE